MHARHGLASARPRGKRAEWGTNEEKPYHDHQLSVPVHVHICGPQAELHSFWGNPHACTPPPGARQGAASAAHAYAVRVGCAAQNYSRVGAARQCGGTEYEQAGLAIDRLRVGLLLRACTAHPPYRLIETHSCAHLSDPPAHSHANRKSTRAHRAQAQAVRSLRPQGARGGPSMSGRAGPTKGLNSNPSCSCV